MKMSVGTTRRVFIFKHVVIKVARVYWRRALEKKIFLFISILGFIFKLGIKEYFRRKNANKKRWAEYKKDPEEIRINEQAEIKFEQWMGMKRLSNKRYEVLNSTSYYLFAGIMANRQERSYYRGTKNVFVQPTYFSFLEFLIFKKRAQR